MPPYFHPLYLQRAHILSCHQMNAVCAMSYVMYEMTHEGGHAVWVVYVADVGGVDRVGYVVLGDVSY